MTISAVFSWAKRAPFEAFIWAGVALLASALLAVILLPALPPLQDYWEWTYQGAVIEQMWASPSADSPFEFRAYPVPNSFSQVLIALLSVPFSAAIAAKLVMLLYAALVGVFLFQFWTYAPTNTRLFALPLLLGLFFGSQFLNGYSNNVFGNLFLSFYALALLKASPKATTTLLFSILIFFCHATSFAVFGMLVGLSFLLRRLSWLHVAAVVPTGLMFLAYMFLKDSYSDDALVLGSVFDWVFYKAYTIAKLGPYHNFVFNDVGDLTRAPLWFWAGVLFNLVFAALLGALLFSTLRNVKAQDFKQPVLLVPLIIFAAYPLMPTSISGVVNIGERFIQIAALLMILMVVKHAAKPLLMAIGALSLVMVPTVFSLAAQSLSVAPSTGEWTEAEKITSDNRLEKLFWHRPVQGAHRLQDIQQIQTEGLSAAQPLVFTTSIIGPKPNQEDPVDANLSD